MTTPPSAPRPPCSRDRFFRDHVGVDGPIRILIPVYEDWEALQALIPALDAALSASGLTARVLVVDDGSMTEAPPMAFSLKALLSIELLRLRRNLGHQRALAVGLARLDAHADEAFVVVMDGDGEDDPRDVPRLVEAAREDEGRRVVFARRKRRADRLAFRLFYQAYRVIHRILTGRSIRFGNFSVLPRRHLIRLVAVAELWNHYAAAVVHSGLPYRELPTDRAPRIRGRSKMGFVDLVTHGLSAISVYSETVGTRLLVASGCLAGLSLLGMGLVAAIRIGTSAAIPGWATYSMAFLFVILLQSATAGFVFTFTILAARNQLGFLPCRDYETFVREVSRIHPPAGADGIAPLAAAATES